LGGLDAPGLPEAEVSCPRRLDTNFGAVVKCRVCHWWRSVDALEARRCSAAIVNTSATT
jgi:hypothetical protein